MANAYGPRPTARKSVADTFRPTAQSADRDVVNTSVWISKDTRKALRVLGAEHDLTFSELIEEGAQLVLRKYSAE